MSKQQNEADVEMPEECYSLDKVPHEFVLPFIFGVAISDNCMLQLALPSN
jgi:hypothetical protein